MEGHWAELFLWKGRTVFMEGQNHFHGRAGPLLWKGRTIFMEGQDHFYGRVGPYLWKGRMGLNSNLAIKKSLIPGMVVMDRLFTCLHNNLSMLLSFVLISQFQHH